MQENVLNEVLFAIDSLDLHSPVFIGIYKKKKIKVFANNDLGTSTKMDFDSPALHNVFTSC